MSGLKMGYLYTYELAETSYQVFRANFIGAAHYQRDQVVYASHWRSWRRVKRLGFRLRRV